jgi:hypothetical protein
VDNWDASFSEHWRTSDLVDCILSYAATDLVTQATQATEKAKQVGREGGGGMRREVEGRKTEERRRRHVTPSPL